VKQGDAKCITSVEYLMNEVKLPLPGLVSCQTLTVPHLCALKP